MKIRLKAVGVGAAALALVAGVLLGTGSAAFAANPPAWEPDANALGSIQFFNSSGAPVTGGSLNDHPVAVYAAATGPGRPGDTKAQLKAFTPQVGVLPGLWSGDTLTGATNYPITGGPSNISSMTNPVATGTSGDLSMSDYISEFPNTTTQTGYQNLYELRLYTSGPGQGQGAQYYRADILVDPTAQTWSVAFAPVAQATTTTIAANPPVSAPSGAAVTLTATVSPTGAAGSVDFTDNGGADLGSASVDASGHASITIHPSDGSHSFTAAFTPTDPTAFQASSSSALPYTVVPPGTPTNTTLSANPPSPATADSSGNVSVALTANVSPTGVAGSVEFFDGGTDLGAGSYTASTGVATKTVTLDAAHSPHLLTATFTPSASGFQPSTSLIMSYTVIPVNFGTGSITINAQDNTPPFAGSLSMSVTTTTVAMTQVDPTTAAGHPAQATDPTHHRHAYVFTGNLSGVSVIDTRPAESGWTVTGQSTDFTGPTPITADHLGWTPASATGDAEGTVAPGAEVDPILQTATSNGLAHTSNLASAAAGNGLGTANLSAGLAFWIPDTSPVGLYSSTLTLTLISP